MISIRVQMHGALFQSAIECPINRIEIAAIKRIGLVWNLKTFCLIDGGDRLNFIIIPSRAVSTMIPKPHSGNVVDLHMDNKKWAKAMPRAMGFNQ